MAQTTAGSSETSPRLMAGLNRLKELDYVSTKRTARGVHSSALIRFFPIILFFAYITLTIALFAFGPWKYPLVDATGLYVFLTLAQSALLVGYLTVRWQPPAGRVVPGPALFMPSLVVTLLLLIPTALLNTGQAVPD